MRALAAVLVAAFVIALSGAGPVSAQESSTPGLWINPKLGLATPEDAARRYEGPLHAWLIDEGDPRRQEPDWRERAFLLFGEDWSEALESWDQMAWRELREAQPEKFGLGHWYGQEWPAEIPPPPPGPAPLRVESCANLLAAYRAGLRPRPALESAWHGARLNFFHLGVYLFYECLALEHLTRLQPLEGDFGDVPAFWGDRATVLRLSPVVFGQSPGEFVQHNLIAELSDTPHLENARKIRGRLHAGDQIIEDPWWPDPGIAWWKWIPGFVCGSEDRPPVVWAPLLERYCVGDDILAPDQAWSVTAPGDAQRAAEFYFASEFLVEGEAAAHTLTVLGVGALPEAEGVVLVVMVVEDLKRGSRKYDTRLPLVLNYDPDLDMFRVINFDDFSLMFLDDVPLPLLR